MLVWTMILTLVTGQTITIDVASEDECRKALAEIESGRQMLVTLKNGITLPVAKGIDCMIRRKRETPVS